MTMVTRPTREQVEAYWHIEGTPKPAGYDYWYDNINEQEDEDED